MGIPSYVWKVDFGGGFRPESGRSQVGKNPGVRAAIQERRRSRRRNAVTTVGETMRPYYVLYGGTEQELIETDHKRMHRIQLHKAASRPD
jgi:hypothetical protein